MEWQRDTMGVHKLTAGKFRALVWYTGQNTWAAEVLYGITRYTTVDLSTLDVARAWCITELATLRAADREDGTIC